MSSQDLSRLPEERDRPRITSPRNRLQGTVLAIKKDALVAQVELACGPYRVVSLMSREAADELDLQPGDQATAIVKSAAVFIEPTGRREAPGLDAAHPLTAADVQRMRA
jgi:molybdopterin-binding protein